MGLEGITMNREIKFRIWNNTIKYFVKNLNGEIATFTLLTLSDYLQRNSITNIDDFTFLRYTGLQDKNGREIYEGDIIKDLDEENLIIEFQNGSFIANGKTIIPFWSMLVKNELVQPAMVNSQTFEVVGNVFENPELLK